MSRENLVPSVFFSYSHADENLRDQLETQLAMLKRQQVIEAWHDRRIGAGQEIDQAISEHSNKDDIILLLISPDFLASDYCYDIEMKLALERHAAGTAIVIPVILRACDWHHAPFGQLLATPRDGKPVTQWPDRDDAFLQVAKAVRDAAGRLQVQQPAPEELVPARATSRSGDDMPMAVALPPRSSNLRLAKTFSQRDRDQFKLDTFDYIASYFENSLAELALRNAGCEGMFRRVDANRFVSTIYQDGHRMAQATVFSGGGIFGNGINYVAGDTAESSALNESLSVDADEQALFLRSTGLSTFGNNREQKLSQEGAAELLWGLLIAPLQQQNWQRS